MATKIEKSASNIISFEGYLRENTLSRIITAKEKKNAIMGVLDIALSSDESYKIRFIASETTSSGGASRMYQALEKMLPDNTTTIVDVLKANPGIDFDAAKENVSKVWARGCFDTYDRKDEGGNIHTYVSFRGLSAGIRDLSNSKIVFTPKAEFEIEGYVDRIKPETQDGEETGRVIASIAIPDYFRKKATTYDFVCEGDVVTQFENYNVGDCGLFQGKLNNRRIAEAGPATEFLDGSTEANVTYSFVNEQLLVRMTAPYMDNHKNYIDAETIKQFKAQRQAELDELVPTGDRSRGEAPQFLGSTTNAAPASGKKFTF